MNTTAPITDAQVDYLWSLIKAGRHEAPNVIEGPTTLDGIQALTKAQASEYIDSIKNPKAPVPVDENGELLPAYVTFKVGPNSYAFEMVAPVVAPGTIPGVYRPEPTCKAFATDVGSIIRKALSTAKIAQYQTEAAPYGWAIDGLSATDTTVAATTYPMRPITQAEHAEQTERNAQARDAARLRMREVAAEYRAERQA